MTVALPAFARIIALETAARLRLGEVDSETVDIIAQAVWMLAKDAADPAATFSQVWRTIWQPKGGTHGARHGATAVRPVREDDHQRRAQVQQARAHPATGYP